MHFEFGLPLLDFCFIFPEIMASAAGLLSPGLVSLVRRAQQVRLEMDENSTKGKKNCFLRWKFEIHGFNFLRRIPRGLVTVFHLFCVLDTWILVREVAWFYHKMFLFSLIHTYLCWAAQKARRCSCIHKLEIQSIREDLHWESIKKCKIEIQYSKCIFHHILEGDFIERFCLTEKNLQSFC